MNMDLIKRNDPTGTYERTIETEYLKKSLVV